MSPLTTITRVACLLAICTSVTHADVDTSHHKAVYQEVNQNLGSFTKVTANVEGESGPVALTGWIQNDVIRKIVATPGSTGAGMDEFYLEDDKPLFVFGTRKNEETGQRIEERVYFANGRIVEWLTTDESFIPHAEDYVGFATQLTGLVTTYIDALTSSSRPSKTLTGIFVGIEQGDYTHWNMKTTTGEVRSFFLLKPSDALEQVLANPQKYEGRTCRITWMSSVEELESAGGKITIDQITDVSWE